MIKSFLRWPGSKYKLLNRILPELEGYARLNEVFVGSGVIFLNSEHDRYFISDFDPDLMTIYRALKEQPEKYLAAVERMFVKYPNNEKTYYYLRDRFNRSNSPYRRAVIYKWLNAHCFNGLHRKNKSNIYNVPYGDVKRPNISEQSFLVAVNKMKKTQLMCADFAETSGRIRSGSVTIADPPYLPLKPTSDFVGYTGKGFDYSDQERLVIKAKQWCERGSKVLICNHDTPLARNLYRHANSIDSLQVHRSLSAAVSSRGKVREIIAIFE